MEGFIVAFLFISQNQIHLYFRSSGSKFRVKALEAFTDMTKLVEALSLERVYYDVIRFSQCKDCRQFSVSIILMSHDLSQPINKYKIQITKR